MKLIIFAVVMAMLVIGCSSNPTNPAPTPKTIPHTLVGQATQGTMVVRLYCEKPLQTGYNTVYVQVDANNNPLTGYVTLGSSFVTCPMLLDCPVIQPQPTPDSLGLYTGAVVFTLPGDSAEWKVLVNVYNTTSHTMQSIEVPVTVAGTGLVAELGNTTDKTVVAILQQTWKVGMNSIGVVLFSGNDSTYTQITDATVSVTPTMPSMGHGSSGNVDPTLQADGSYQGIVNYSMSGPWQIDLGITTPAQGTQHALFNVTVPR